MVDIDGHEAFSKVIVIKTESGKAVLKVYPTVTSTSVTVEFTALQNQPYSLSVIDGSGKLISRQIKVAVPGINRYQEHVDKLSAGIYLIVHECSGVKNTAKFIKQ
jgi:hypothetical protein